MAGKITLDQWEDISERAIATFWQGAIAAAPATVLADWGGIRAGLTAMAIGGVAALLSSARGIVRAKRQTARS